MRLIRVLVNSRMRPCSSNICLYSDGRQAQRVVPRQGMLVGVIEWQCSVCRLEQYSAQNILARIVSEPNRDDAKVTVVACACANEVRVRKGSQPVVAVCIPSGVLEGQHDVAVAKRSVRADA